MVNKLRIHRAGDRARPFNLYRRLLPVRAYAVLVYPKDTLSRAGIERGAPEAARGSVSLRSGSAALLPMRPNTGVGAPEEARETSSVF
jgi:hypothetical protein